VNKKYNTQKSHIKANKTQVMCYENVQTNSDISITVEDRGQVTTEC